MSEKGERKVLWGGAGGVDTMDQSVGRRCGAGGVTEMREWPSGLARRDNPKQVR